MLYSVLKHFHLVFKGVYVCQIRYEALMLTFQKLRRRNQID